MFWIVLVCLPVLVVTLAYRRVPLPIWLLTGLVWIAAMGWAADGSVLLTFFVLALYAGAMSLFLVESWRRQWVTAPIFKAFRKALEIYPQFDAVKKAVDSLKTDVDGRDA